MNPDQYLLLIAEVERLTMINRELIKENNSLQMTKGPISAEKVEQLLKENEKLNILVNQLSKEMNMAKPDVSVNEELQNKVQLLLEEVSKLNNLIKQHSSGKRIEKNNLTIVKLESYYVKPGFTHKGASNQPYTQDLSTLPQSMTGLPQSLHEESVLMTSGPMRGQLLGQSQTIAKSHDDLMFRERMAQLESENDTLRKEIATLKAESQRAVTQKKKLTESKEYEELNRRLKQLEPQEIELIETKKKCVILGVGFERLIAEVKAKDKEIERLNKTLKQTENEAKRALDYERSQKERLEKELERLNRKLDEKSPKKSPTEQKGISELERQNRHLKQDLSDAAGELEQLKERLMIMQADNERINHMLAMKDKELDLLRPKALAIDEKDLTIEALKEELIRLNAQLNESKGSEGKAASTESRSSHIDVTRLLKERDELRQHLEERKKQILILEKDVDDLLAGYDELEEYKKKCEQQAADLHLLQQELDNRDQKIESLLKKQREQKEKESGSHESQVIDLKGEVTNLRNRVNQLVQERDSMLEALNYKDKEIASLGAYLDELNESLKASSHKKLEKSGTALDTLKKEIMNRNKAVEELTQENKGLQRAVTNLENIRGRILSIMGKRDVEIENLTRQLDEISPELKALREQVKLLSSENIYLQRKCEGLELKLSSAEKKHKQLESLYIEARGASEDVEKVHEKLVSVCSLTEEVDPNVKAFIS